MGKRADFTAFATNDYREILYQATQANLVQTTFLKGVRLEAKTR